MSSAPVTEVKVSPAPPVITLAGKVAIVTGASRGIGQSIALRLARDGAKVVVNYQKDQKSAEAVVKAITSTGGSATAVQADVSSSTDVDRLFAETKRVYGRVDIVIANAGIAIGGPIATTSNADFDKLFDVNVKGVFYTIRAAANNIENNGRIIVLGSILRSGTTPNIGPYAATKGAVEVLANTLAQELGSKGVTVNTIHPGPTDTDMLAPMVATPQARSGMEGISPFKRLGTVADLGDAVALIVSESARWISGQSIYVTGAGK